MSGNDRLGRPRRQNSRHPGERARFLDRQRADFDPEGALAASRAGPLANGDAGNLAFALPNGRLNLWQPLGPMTVLGGQAVGAPHITGRVDALAIDSTSARVYAATANGGIWYSSDGGSHWKSLGGLAPTNAGEINRPAQRNACGAIRVVFGAGEADDDVYVGTGETTYTPNAQPGIGFGGIGILFAHGPAASALDDPWRREAKNLIGAGVSRIDINPAGTIIVAATTNGLLQRPNPAAVDVDWVRVAGTPFNTLTERCTDVLWTPASGARPERLWVWVSSGDNKGLWVRSGAEVNFTRVVEPGVTPGFPKEAGASRRAVLAPSQPPDQLYLLIDAAGAPLLYRISAATAAVPTAAQVTGVPDILHGFGFYALALAIHPTLPDRVIIGGSFFAATSPDGTALLNSGNTDDGAIVSGDVALNGAALTFGFPSPFTMIGIGVHADIHDLQYSNNGARLWAACDGGVFRSDSPTKQVGFFPCNDGLPIIEANYIANHPTCEGYVITGLQDNGVIGRRSNGVWNHEGDGDGGGVAFDQRQPNRYVRQFFNGGWGGVGPSSGGFLLPIGAKEYNKLASFYSTPAAIANHRAAAVPPAPQDFNQIILGTSRVWYTEDFGSTWVTLPTATLPPPGNTTQDDFGQKITVCRWQSPDVAWILSEGRLMRYARTPGSDNAGGPGVWTRETIITKGVKNKKDATSADGPIRDSAVWTDIAVNLDPPPAAGQPPAVHGTKGAVYLGTIGKPDDTNVDTLWWFDGTSKWFKTNLRNDPNGAPAPVTSIVCDPAFPNEVYVGTTVGVWKGTRVQVGAADPTWGWTRLVNGLPEAVVQDLAIFSDGRGLRLLRAAIAARGAWELRLDTPNVTDLTYLRAHDDDLRYATRAVEKQRDLVTDRSWHGSPDVRPRRPSRSRTAPTSLPWHRTKVGIDTEDLRRFQSALHAQRNDPRVRPTGKWDLYFNEVLRDLGAPLLPPPLPANTVGINTAFWNATMVAPHATADPWGAGTPDEADLLELNAGLAEGDANSASCALPRRAMKVDILVHHRGLDSVDGANVRVTLLWWADPRTKGAANWNNASTWFTDTPAGAPVPWTPAINQVLNSADGKTSQSLGGGWHFALGTSTQSHRITLAGQTLDSTHSGVATFDLDLSARRRNSLVILVAVIRAGTSAADDIALAPATLKELVLTSPNVAVRSIHLI